MTVDLNFVEGAAVDCLRKLLDAVDAGEVAVVDFSAVDKPDGWGVAVRIAHVVVENGTAPPPASSSSSSPPAPLRANSPCPDCGGRLEDVIDNLACVGCGRTHPFSG